VGLTNDDARRRFLPMNCISWNIGHLAWQEQRYWLHFAQDRLVLPEINTEFRSGGPASTPVLDDMLTAWDTITASTDPWLDALVSSSLDSVIRPDDRPWTATIGSLLLRTTYHYWFHNGENAAIRQMLGHTDLPQFVGDLDHEAPYRPPATA
jgi:hypothetical protein